MKRKPYTFLDVSTKLMLISELHQDNILFVAKKSEVACEG